MQSLDFIVMATQNTSSAWSPSAEPILLNSAEYWQWKETATTSVIAISLNIVTISVVIVVEWEYIAEGK